MNPSYRNHKLGFKVKLAQRERVLTQGVKHITWTFDPLQSLNAHLNFGKLGVISDTYKINFYGEKTSSFLHQIGTVIGSGIFIVPSAVLRSANIFRAADNHRFGEYYLMWWRIIPK